MPIPVSFTSKKISTVSSSSATFFAVNKTSPSTVNLTALLTRLLKTCLSLEGSPKTLCGTSECIRTLISISFYRHLPPWGSRHPQERMQIEAYSPRATFSDFSLEIEHIFIKDTKGWDFLHSFKNSFCSLVSGVSCKLMYPITPSLGFWFRGSYWAGTHFLPLCLLCNVFSFLSL